MLLAALFQFDGGRLAGYGERPEGVDGVDATCASMAARCSPCRWSVFLFTNLMNSPQPEPGSGILGYIMSLPIMGKLLFGTFLIGVPGDPCLVLRQGQPRRNSR